MSNDTLFLTADCGVVWLSPTVNFALMCADRFRFGRPNRVEQAINGMVMGALLAGVRLTRIKRLP